MTSQRGALRRLLEAKENTEAAKQEFLDWIIVLDDMGASHVKIAKELKVSRQRVWQIVQRARALQAQEHV